MKNSLLRHVNFYKATFTGRQNQWDTQTRWNLTRRHRARDLYSRAKPCPLCFFHEALCGWAEPKNNLHNMVEKKLIPQPHLLLWVRLLIYRFMTGCVVFIATSQCVCASSQGMGKVLVWGWERSKLTNNVRWEWNSPHPASLLLQHCSSHCSLFLSNSTQGDRLGTIYCEIKNRRHQAILYCSRQLEREQFSEHLFKSEQEGRSRAHSKKRNTYKQLDV